MRELAAALVEEMAATVAEGLRGAPGRTPERAPLEAKAGTTENPYTDAAGLPRPEEGDEFSGLEHERMIIAPAKSRQGTASSTRTA